MTTIGESPDRWPAYLVETRRYLLKRFPFLVVYRQRDGAIQVIAVAHGCRRPGYWRDRQHKPRNLTRCCKGTGRLLRALTRNRSEGELALAHTSLQS